MEPTPCFVVVAINGINYTIKILPFGIKFIGASICRDVEHLWHRNMACWEGLAGCGMDRYGIISVLKRKEHG